jgi:hypothetical protein
VAHETQPFDGDPRRGDAEGGHQYAAHQRKAAGGEVSDIPAQADEDGVAVPAFGSDWLLDRLAACVDGSYGYFCPLGG